MCASFKSPPPPLVCLPPPNAVYCVSPPTPSISTSGLHLSKLSLCPHFPYPNMSPSALSISKKSRSLKFCRIISLLSFSALRAPKIYLKSLTHRIPLHQILIPKIFPFFSNFFFVCVALHSWYFLPK